MRLTVCHLDPSLSRDPGYLDELRAHLAGHPTDLLLLPEMPFTPWLPARPDANAAAWTAAAETHDRRVPELATLGVDAVVSTRPAVDRAGPRRNRAFLWTRDGGAAPIRDKHYLPEEDGYWEQSWYAPGPRSFETARAGAATLGVLICTELWFLEWARHYGRQGADLLCVPRATSGESRDKWLAGGRTAAVCSGAYCLSSNLVTGSNAGGPSFGWIVDPDGEVLATTSEAAPFATCAVDLEHARACKSTYPRYVAE